MKSAWKVLPIAALAIAAACSTEPTAINGANGPELKSQSASGNGATSVTVYTQNLYVGADVDAIVAALMTPDPYDDVTALLDAAQTLEFTDFPARARGIAAEIAKTRPQVVGLQEVSTIDLVIPPLGIDYHMDFLSTLLGALNAQGLHYVVAASELNITASPAPGISLQDRDVMLVDADRVDVLAWSGHQFTYNIGVVAPGVDLERGWVQMTAMIGGRTYEIASLHTEGTGSTSDLAGLHALQIADVVAAMGTASPAIVMGDFNSLPTEPAYGVMQSGDFTDVWGAMHPGAAGLTCCEPAALGNSPAQFTDRIDYVWTRGLGDAKGANSVKGQIDRFDEVPADRVTKDGGQKIWLSDHAGLVAEVMILPGR